MYPEVLFPEVAKIYIDTHEEHSRFFLPEIVKVRNNYSWQTKNVNLSDWVDRLREFHNLIEIIKNKNFNRKKRQLLKPKSILAARQLIPLVSAGMHARWLEVESGICQCLNGSDIGSAALLVRGILEEADRCNLIQKDIKKLSLKKLKYSVEVEDLFQRLVLWGLPRVKPRSEEEIKAKIPRQKYSKMDPRLFESINKINEYVHPNYGSHVVTIRPTQAHALEVIKQSLAVAYEVYFEIDWLNNSEVSKTRKIYPSDNEGKIGILGKLNYIFSETKKPYQGKIGIVETLNYILSETKKHYPGKLYSGDLERLIEIVKSDIRNNDHIEKRIKNENFYKPLIKNLAKLEDSVNMLVTNNAPATKIILEAFKLFQSQNFIKMMQLRDQLLESIERYDPISAATFSRAFVEHFAVDKWLTDKSTNLMKNFLKTSKNEYLEAIQGKLAKCLVGGKSSEEDYNAQKQFWEEVYGHQKINLTEVIRNSGDIFSNSYDYLSGVLHGMIITGGDLLGDKKAHHGIRVQTCFFSADAVGRVYSQDLTKYAENAELIYNLNYIDGAKSYGYADQKIANSLKTPSVFKHGKDYFGDGSLESPYKFRPGILYHKNIEALLKQLSFSQVNRSVAEERGSVIVDKWESETGNLLYTQSETLQLLSGAFKNKN